MKREATAAHFGRARVQRSTNPTSPGWALWVLADANPGRAAQVVVGAGAVEHSQLVDLAGNAFGGLPAGGPSTEELVQKARRRAEATRGLKRLHSRRPRCTCEGCLHAPAWLLGSDTKAPFVNVKCIDPLHSVIRNALDGLSSAL